MMRFARRQYLNRSVAALGGVLAAACSLTESLWPGTGSPPRRAAPATLRVLYGRYGPGLGTMYTEVPVDWIGPDGRLEAPVAEWFHTTAAPAFKERYPDSTVSFESHHDPLNRALELHRAGTSPDVFQTDDLRNADLIRRRLAHRLDGWIKQMPQIDDFVQPALLAGQTAGVQWGLPLFSQVYTLYFNRHILQAAGMSQPPTTWGDLLDAAFRSTLVADGELVRAGLPAPHSRWFWWLLQLTGVTLYDGGQVAALENEAEVVLDWLRDLDAAVQPAGVAPLERHKYFPSVEDAARWHLGKVAHAWAPGLPPQPAEFLQRHDWQPASPPPREAAPRQQDAPPPAEVRTAMATAEVEQRRAAREDFPSPGPVIATRIKARRDDWTTTILVSATDPNTRLDGRRDELRKAGRGLLAAPRCDRLDDFPNTDPVAFTSRHTRLDNWTIASSFPPTTTGHSSRHNGRRDNFSKTGPVPAAPHNSHRDDLPKTSPISAAPRFGRLDARHNVRLDDRRKAGHPLMGAHQTTAIWEFVGQFVRLRAAGRRHGRGQATRRAAAQQEEQDDQTDSGPGHVYRYGQSGGQGDLPPN